MPGSAWRFTSCRSRDSPTDCVCVPMPFVCQERRINHPTRKGDVTHTPWTQVCDTTQRRPLPHPKPHVPNPCERTTHQSADDQPCTCRAVVKLELATARLDPMARLDGVVHMHMHMQAGSWHARRAEGAKRRERERAEQERIKQTNKRKKYQPQGNPNAARRAVSSRIFYHARTSQVRVGLGNSPRQFSFLRHVLRYQARRRRL